MKFLLSLHLISSVYCVKKGYLCPNINPYLSSFVVMALGTLLKHTASSSPWSIKSSSVKIWLSPPWGEIRILVGWSCRTMIENTCTDLHNDGLMTTESRFWHDHHSPLIQSLLPGESWRVEDMTSLKTDPGGSGEMCSPIPFCVISWNVRAEEWRLLRWWA